MKTVLVLLIAAAGCVPSGPQEAYRDSLDAMASVDVARAGDAVMIAGASIGIPAASVTGLVWVTAQLRDEHGSPVSGVSIDCDIWVSWWGLHGATGASADGLAVSHTSLAHEMAHCALGLLTGDRDPDHLDPAWWGPCGRVSDANHALSASGL